MLIELAISNFRSCSDVTVGLGCPLVGLVGKNGVGKTNLLHSIRLAAQLCTGLSPWDQLVPQFQDKPTSLSISFQLGTSKYKYRVTRTATDAVPPTIEETLQDILTQQVLFTRHNEALSSPWHRDSLAIGREISATMALLSLLPPDSPGASTLGPISDYLQQIRYYRAKDDIRDHDPASILVLHSHYKNWISAPRVHHSESVALRLIDMHLKNDGRLAELKELLGRNGLGIIDDIITHIVAGNPSPNTDASQPNPPMGYVIFFTPGPSLGGAGRIFAYTGLSAGTRRVIQMLTYLVYDDATVSLLEEPEDSMHWGLLQAVLDIFKSYSKRTQCIFSTHSSRAINMLSPEGVRVVTAESGKTQVHAFNETQISEIRDFIRDSGTLAEYLDSI